MENVRYSAMWTCSSVTVKQCSLHFQRATFANKTLMLRVTTPSAKGCFLSGVASDMQALQ